MIRKANIDDSRVINKLSSHFDYKPVSDDVAFARLKIILQSNTDQIWVIEREAVIRGWIHVFIAHRVASTNFAEIGGLVVSPQDRRNGMGRALVNCADRWANEQNLSLRVRCNARREETDKFYKAIGFTKSKVQNVYENYR